MQMFLISISIHGVAERHDSYSSLNSSIIGVHAVTGNRQQGSLFICVIHIDNKTLGTI